MATNVGEIVIQTKIDNRAFEKGINQMQKDAGKAKESMEDLEKAKEEVFESSGDVDTRLEEYFKKIKEKFGDEVGEDFINQFEAMKEKAQELATQLDPLIEKYEGLMNEYMRATDTSKGMLLFESDKKDAEELKEQIREVVKEIEKLTGEKITIAGFDKSLFDSKELNKETKNIGKSLENIIHKVARWGLAIFGVGSAYTLVRRAISLVASQNEEVANKIQQMKNVLIGVLVPVVQEIVNWLAKAMVYVNYLFKILTGKDLFNFADATKSSSDNLKNGAKSAGGIANNLKEARKQLAGFDEMNVLSDNVASAGGGIGGIDSTDFGNIFDAIKDIKIPDWIVKLGDILKKLKEYWRELLIVVGSFASALLALKLTNFIADLFKLGEVSLATKASIGLIVAGIALLAGSIINLVMNFDEMTEKQKALNGMLAILGASFIALGTSMALGFSMGTLGIGALIAGIVALIAWIGAVTVKEMEEHKAVSDLKTAKENLKKANEELATQTIDYIETTKRAKEAQDQLRQAEEQSGLSGRKLAEQVLSGKLEYDKMSDAQKNVYEKYMRNVEAQEKLSQATEKNKQLIETQKDKIDKHSASLMINKLQMDDNMASMIKGWRNGSISSEEFGKRIEKMMDGMSKKEKELFKKGLPEDIQKAFNLQPVNTFESNFNNSLNRMDYQSERTFGNIERRFKRLDGMNATMTVNTVSSSSYPRSAKGAVIYPRLAVGGIVNQPGRGIPYKGATIGERGAEGVIPLTDSQQMALLGEAIGRYITINANITNSMNGRVISRELQKIQNEIDFAMNR